MATFNAFASSTTTVQWSISNLSSAWNTSNFMGAYLSSSPAISGSSTPPAGIIDSAIPPVTGTDTYTGSQVATGAFSPGNTYTLYGSTRAANGLYFPVGSQTVTMPTDRPSNFSWTFPKISGNNFNLTSSEWNGFTSRINSFRQYKFLSSYPFTTAFTGNDFTASMFNQAVSAISAMSPPIFPPSAVFSGQDIYASYLNGLVSSLNSIS